MTDEAGLKNDLKRLISWANLALTLLLIVFSIYGAFIGAERAKQFFNSIPLTLYWIALAVLLVTGIAIFPRLLRVRGLFLVHVGCVLVIAGAIWGSEKGLKIQDSLFGTNTIHSGRMKIFEGDTKKTVEMENGSEKELPFSVKLVNFKIEYYLLIQIDQVKRIIIQAKPGRKISLGNDLGSVEIVKIFKRFRLIFEGEKRNVIDDPNGALNPALELLIKKPDGSQSTKYVLVFFSGHKNPDDRIRFFYIEPISDFISDLEVVKDDKVLIRKSIEVNKPLHFAGYIFYQSGYDDVAGRFTILRVTSDKGLIAVYLGFISLCTGAFWHFWARHVFGDRVIED